MLGSDRERLWLGLQVPWMAGVEWRAVPTVSGGQGRPFDKLRDRGWGSGAEEGEGYDGDPVGTAVGIRTRVEDSGIRNPIAQLLTQPAQVPYV